MCHYFCIIFDHIFNNKILIKFTCLYSQRKNKNIYKIILEHLAFDVIKYNNVKFIMHNEIRHFSIFVC